MSGPWIGVGINRPPYAPSWLTIYDRAFRLGPADIRPCGCVLDPYVFGHFCTGRKAEKCSATVTVSGAEMSGKARSGVGS